MAIPYKIAAIGGKLEQGSGESPYACALREIQEEIGIQLTLDDIRLMGIVSERGFAASPGEDEGTHWLMFCFEVTRPLDVTLREFEEGRLEWIDPILMPTLDIPKTDRDVIWPLVLEYSVMLHPVKRRHEGEVFSVHIDCTDAEGFVVTKEWPRK
jgi:8-oxo-dGTP diphosphatase